MNDIEIWKQIPSFPNYEASNTGKIRRALNGHILKQRDIDTRKYQIVCIWYNKKKYTKKVARLVWSAFNGCECNETIDHIDRIKTNNSINNLRCISSKENSKNRTIYNEKNKYNLKDEDKINIIRNYRLGIWKISYIAEKYEIPNNYLFMTFRRGSWDKLWKQQTIEITKNISS